MILILSGNALVLYVVCKRLETWKAKKVPNIISGVISVLFPGSLNDLKNDLTGECSKKYNLFGYPAPAGLVNSLGVLSALMSLSLAVTFLKNFFELHLGPICNIVSCDYSNGTFPLKYSFALPVAESLGAAGGVLVLLTALIRVEMMVVMWMIKRKNNSTRICNRRAWSFCSLSIISFIVVLIPIAAISWAPLKALDELSSGSRSNLAHSILEQVLLTMSLMQTASFSLLILYFNWNFDRANREDIEQAQRVELTTSLLSRDDLSSDYHMHSTNGSISEMPDGNIHACD